MHILLEVHVMSTRNHLRSRRDGGYPFTPPSSRAESRPRESNEASASRPDQRPEGWESAEDWGDSLREYEQVVAQYPLVALVTGFSVGFGLGILVTAALAHRREETWLQRQHF